MASFYFVCLQLLAVPFGADGIGHLREVKFTEIQALEGGAAAPRAPAPHGATAANASIARLFSSADFSRAYMRGFKSGFDIARTFVSPFTHPADDADDPCADDGCEDGNPWHSDIFGPSDIFNHPRSRGNGTGVEIPVGFGLLRGTPPRDWAILLLAVLVCMALDGLVLQPVCQSYARRSEATEEKLLEVFQAADVKGKGYITGNELADLWEKSPDIRALAAETRGEVQDSKEGATISWEEFRELHGPVADPKAAMRRKTMVNVVALAFWILVAGVFNMVILKMRGWETGVQWCSGYLLEWLLSLDNLFVFHLIFQAYATPRPLLHKALFVGIVGAVVFRMCFFMVVGSLLHLVHWFRYIFGALLIYSGIQAAKDDDDEPDIQNSMAFRVLKGCLGSRLSERYDLAGHRLFVAGADGRLCATLLVPVIFCLEATDILFAVDSVSAKLAQIPDYYIAYSSSVMAIFGLRAMFFLVQDIVDYFELMKYGLCFILVFIGIELILAEYVKLPAQVVLVVIVSVFVVCAAGSTYQHLYRRKSSDITADDRTAGRV